MPGVFERGGVWYDVPAPVPLERTIRAALLNALAYTNGHQHQAARLLGLTPDQMGYQMVAHGIPTVRGRRKLCSSSRSCSCSRRFC